MREAHGVLDAPQAVAYLLRCGLISPAGVVDGELVVMDASRRNYNLAVIPQTGPGYLLKQPRDERAAAALANEAAVYNWLGGSHSRSADYLPTLYRYEPGGPLVLEYLAGHETMRNRIGRRGRFAKVHGRLAGRALAELHRHSRPSGSSPVADLAVPWVLTLDCPELAVFREFQGARNRALRIIQQHPEFGSAFTRLRRRWHCRVLVHNDPRWDNLLVPIAEGAGLRIVDWELAGWGDPAWDVGATLAQYLACWVTSMPATAALDTTTTLALARYPLARMQPAIRACWLSYRRHAEPGSVGLVPATEYAAATLVQFAVERAASTSHVDGVASVLLQVSANMLRWPADAAATLLGLAEDDR